MKPAAEWKDALRGGADPAALEVLEGRGGAPTLKWGSVYLHSRYNPQREAAQLVESAALETGRPVLVAGLGLGYHVAELRARGFEVAVVEPELAVARHALAGPAEHLDFLLHAGDMERLGDDPIFQALARRNPQLLIHPPTASLHPKFAQAAGAALARAALGGRHLNIAVVGPLYGGSLPIAGYLVDAFRRLGHRTEYIDHSNAWPLYQEITGSVKDPKASAQLGQMTTNMLSEWAYARVAEFDPEICIVLAQAPVGQQFPVRLGKKGIVTAFWYVENWRHMPYWQDIAPFYDSFFHIQPGVFEEKLAAAGCRHIEYIQTACDPRIHQAVELAPEETEEFNCDLSFAGAGYYNRLQLFKGLTDYDFKIWGVEWQERELSRHVVGGERRFDSETFMQIVAGSKINLNLHSSSAHNGVDPNCDAVNPRLFEIAAAGGFQLCDPCIGLDTLFDFGTELPVYRDLRELRAKIDHFLAHPEERAAIAEAARARVLKEHTYEHRAQQMLDHLFEHHGGRLLKKGIRVQKTVAEVTQELGPDDELGAWLATLPEDLLFTQDGINAMLSPGYQKLGHPEKIFSYLKDVRDFAENMLRARR